MPTSKQHYAVIVAAGQGKRMQSSIPKQFMPLKGKPILMHTITNLHSIDSSLRFILVLSKEHIPLWQKLCSEYAFNLPITIVEGGKERFDSVKRGLAEVENDSIVAIHDGVRPFVGKNVWKQCFDMAESASNAVPALIAKDSIRLRCKETTKTFNRNDVYLIQTPQCFHSNLIKSAYNQPFNPLFTDDIQVFESIYDNKINIIEGNAENIKITTPFDVLIADSIAAEWRKESS
ncbi:MAG: 2-C-methyl-D-erythritol 4-phosphate cytidylyltransferase [Bacteroidales bacterium]|jgi:2-C-methyl-D-erythritol 4-phosphate cytidylyltransferase|nr:2-C-methyl-D-erythritol 4-phosphate cytidylyltransferase [Bacteroidales bacterium]